MPTSVIRAASAFFAIVAALAMLVAVLSFSGAAQADEPLTANDCLCAEDADSCTAYEGSFCSNDGSDTCNRCDCCQPGSDQYCANPCD